MLWGLTMNRWIVAFCCVLLCGSYSRAEDSLLYCVSKTETKDSRQSLSKTEVFAVDPTTGQQRLVFSDARSKFVLLPGSDVQLDVVAAGGRIFSRAMDRKLYANGRMDNPAAIYELSADGSGKARKITDIHPNASMGSNFHFLFVSPTGAKLGYIRISGGKPYLFLHETSTGGLLRELDLTESVSSMSVTTIGWMPDGKRLYFTLNRTDEDDEWPEPESLMGSYIMEEDGSGKHRVAPEKDLHPSRQGLNVDPKASAVLLGPLPDGRYLLKDMQGSAKVHPAIYVYVLSVATKVQETLSIDGLGELRPYRLSPSGHTVATVSTQLKSIIPDDSADTKTLWVVNVESGSRRKLLTFTPQQDGTRWTGLIGWLGSHDAKAYGSSLAR